MLMICLLRMLWAQPLNFEDNGNNFQLFTDTSNGSNPSDDMLYLYEVEICELVYLFKIIVSMGNNKDLLFIFVNKKLLRCIKHESYFLIIALKIIHKNNHAARTWFWNYNY